MEVRIERPKRQRRVPVSPMLARSLQIRWNSFAGMRTTAEYSVSGIPRCSLSMSMSLSSKSDILSFSACYGAREPGVKWLKRQVLQTPSQPSAAYENHFKGYMLDARALDESAQARCYIWERETYLGFRRQR